MLGTPNVSALAADFMRRLLDADLLMRRDYTEGRPSNLNPVDPTGRISGGLNPSMIVSGPLTKEPKEHELIVIIVDALEAMLELEAVRRVSMNVHEGDPSMPPKPADVRAGIPRRLQRRQDPRNALPDARRQCALLSGQGVRWDGGLRARDHERQAKAHRGRHDS